jgi:hypothetical protein
MLARPLLVHPLDRHDPALVLLARLNPAVEDIARVLAENGISDVIAWSIQARVEERIRSQRRKANKMVAELQADAARRATQTPDNFVGTIVPGPSGGNRRTRKALVKHGDRKRRERELAIERLLARQTEKLNGDLR